MYTLKNLTEEEMAVIREGVIAKMSMACALSTDTTIPEYLNALLKKVMEAEDEDK